MAKISDKFKKLRDEKAHEHSLSLPGQQFSIPVEYMSDYAGSPGLYSNTISFQAGFDTACAELLPVIEEMREALKFTLNAAENLYRPDAPLDDKLDPMFYHTLTYEGDLELINKTKKIREVLDRINKILEDK